MNAPNNHPLVWVDIRGFNWQKPGMPNEILAQIASGPIDHLLDGVLVQSVQHGTFAVHISRIRKSNIQSEHQIANRRVQLMVNVITARLDSDEDSEQHFKALEQHAREMLRFIRAEIKTF